MNIIYELTIHAKCPVDGSDDIYQMTVTTSEIIPVELILDIVKECSALPIFQESLTESLAAKLQTTVKTVGYHTGVKTTCESSE